MGTIGEVPRGEPDPFQLLARGGKHFGLIAPDDELLEGKPPEARLFIWKSASILSRVMEAKYDLNKIAEALAAEGHASAVVLKRLAAETTEAAPAGKIHLVWALPPGMPERTAEGQSGLMDTIYCPMFSGRFTFSDTLETTIELLGAPRA